MPNHVQNRLHIFAGKSWVSKVRAAISSTDEEGKEVQIDFNKIKPCPECMHITSGSLGEMAHELLFGTKEKSFFPISVEENQKRFAKLDIEQQKEAVDLAIKYQYNLVTYGATTWYDWQCNNWGTKWNAYDQNDDRNSWDTIYFNTAWSAPVPVIEELSRQFPKVEFILTYADEDAGSNTGEMTFKAGVCTEEDLPETGSEAAMRLYFDLHPGREEDYEFVNGEWRYKDDDEEENLLPPPQNLLPGAV